MVKLDAVTIFFGLVGFMQSKHTVQSKLQVSKGTVSGCLTLLFCCFWLNCSDRATSIHHCLLLVECAKNLPVPLKNDAHACHTWKVDLLHVLDTGLVNEKLKTTKLTLTKCFC